MNETIITISTDQSKLDMGAIKLLMKQTRWAVERTEETILKSIENSICFGVYMNEDQIGFARAVTDYATVYWICDVIIDEKYRGRGLGKMLLDNIQATKELDGLLGILATQDAHGLYEKYGFVKEREKFMMKKRTRQ